MTRDEDVQSNQSNESSDSRKQQSFVRRGTRRSSIKISHLLQASLADTHNGGAVNLDDEEKAHIPSDVMHLIVLSRVVESLRFTVGPSLLEEKITLGSLKSAFSQHNVMLEEESMRKSTRSASALLKDKSRASPLVDEGETTLDDAASAKYLESPRGVNEPDHSGDSEFSDAMKEIFHHLELLWAVIERDHSTPLDITFGDAFDYEFPSFPESTDEQREILRGLCHQEVITMADVVSALDVEPTEQIIEFIFASGASLIPREVFKDIVGCLDQHPRVSNFARTYVQNVAKTGVGMQSLIWHLALLLAILIMSPSMVSTDHLQLFDDMDHWFNHEWSQGCPPNGTSCNFLKRTFATGTRPELDAARYIQTELITLLWREEGTLDYPLGGAWPVGALLFRGVGESSSDTVSCDSLNLSSTVYHWDVPVAYPCSSEWGTIIPFSATREEALELAANNSIPTRDQSRLGTFAVIVHMAAVQASTNLLVSVRAVMTFPRGGGVMPKLIVQPINLGIDEVVVTWLVLKILGTAWYLLAIIPHIRTKVWSKMELFVDLTSTVLIITSYAILSNLAVDPEHLAQRDYIVPHVDTLGDRYDTGISVLAFFAFLTVLNTVRYTQHIPGMQLMYDILRAAGLEIFGLIFMYFMWSLGFVSVGMLLFGGTTQGFATFALAVRNVFFVFAGTRPFDDIAENHPITGPVFFFLLDLFVVFFALNLLIAVITAPLAKVKEMNQLQERVYVKLRAQVGEHSVAQLVWVGIKHYVVWPLVAAVVDCSPLTQRHWTGWKDLMTTFYAVSNAHQIGVAQRMIMGASRLLEYASSEGTSEIHSDGLPMQKYIWESPLLDLVISDKFIDDEIALALVIVCISTETRWSIVRDARLMAALRDYEVFRRPLRRVAELQTLLKAEVLAQTSTLQKLIEAGDTEHTQGNVLTRFASALDHSAVNVPGSPQAAAAEKHARAAAKSTTYSSFLFSQVLETKLDNSSRLFVYTILSVVFAIVTYVPYFIAFSETAFLTRALHMGLRDMEIVTACKTADCATAVSVNKTFMEIGDFEELDLWLEGVLFRQLYSRRIAAALNVSENSPQAVLWDPRIVMEGPLIIRQLRAPRSSGCDGLVPDGFDVEATKAGYPCQNSVDGASSFDKSNIPYPADGKPSLIPDSAYVYTTRCPNAQNDVLAGTYHDYPCEGFIVEIGDEVQFKQVIDSHWFNNYTRLLAIQGIFSYSNETACEYTLYLELAENGAAMSGRAFITATKSQNSISNLDAQLIFYRVLLALDVGVVVVQLLMYLHARAYKGLPANECEGLLPKIPVVELMIFVVTFIVAPALPSGYVQDTTTAVCALLYLLFHLTTKVVFPAAELLSKQVKVLVTALWRALLQSLFVVPFFALAIWAFVLLGYFMFGRFVPEFARLRWALQEIALMSFTGDIPTTELQAARYVETQVFVVLFFAVILVVLSNLFLAMVTSATADANVDKPAVELSEGVLGHFGYRVLYGKFLTWFIAVSRRIASFKRSDHPLAGLLPSALRRRRPREAAVMFHDGRLLFPTEVLMTTMPPLRINALLDNFTVDEINVYAYGALCPWVLENYARFLMQAPQKAAFDNRKVAYEEIACAKRLLDNRTHRTQTTAKSLGTMFAPRFGIAPKRRQSTEIDDDPRFPGLGDFTRELQFQDASAAFKADNEGSPDDIQTPKAQRAASAARMSPDSLNPSPDPLPDVIGASRADDEQPVGMVEEVV